jgi:hypothetical protein
MAFVDLQLDGTRARRGGLRQKASEKRPGNATTPRGARNVQLFDEEHGASIFDARDAVGEARADAVRPFQGDEQWRAGLECNFDRTRDLLVIGGEPVLCELRGQQFDDQRGISNIG